VAKTGSGETMGLLPSVGIGAEEMGFYLERESKHS
jgi:hypothetical protein